MNTPNQPKIIAVGRLNEKSQLVIPKEARELLGIGPGDRVLFSTAPFMKAIFIARPDDVEAQLLGMMSSAEKAIGDVRKKLKPR